MIYGICESFLTTCKNIINSTKPILLCTAFKIGLFHQVELIYYVMIIYVVNSTE